MNKVKQFYIYDTSFLVYHSILSRYILKEQVKQHFLMVLSVLQKLRYYCLER